MTRIDKEFLINQLEQEIAYAKTTEMPQFRSWTTESKIDYRGIER